MVAATELPDFSRSRSLRDLFGLQFFFILERKELVEVFELEVLPALLLQIELKGLSGD